MPKTQPPLPAPRCPRLRGETGLCFVRARAFTLIELIVVVVLLGVVAGLAAPRLMSNASRRAESNMREIADVLGIAARRDASGGGSAGESQRLAFDGEKKTFALQVRRARVNGRGETEDAGVWRNDPLSPVVNLEYVKVSRVVIDGVAADDRAWTLDFVPGQVRPTVEMVIESVSGGDAGRGTGGGRGASGGAGASGGGPRWNVLLLPYGTSAEIASLGVTPSAASSAAALRSIDLDASGVGDRPW
jgi:prepilin-type N-terminal cleavage/methylation domain-containing protein